MELPLMWYCVLRIFVLSGVCYAHINYNGTIYRKLTKDIDPLIWGIEGQYRLPEICCCIGRCQNLPTCLAISYDDASCTLLGSAKLGEVVWNNTGISLTYVKPDVIVDLPVFRASRGSGIPVLASWKNDSSSVPMGSFNMSEPLRGFYKHRFVDEWDISRITKVTLQLYDEGIEVFGLMFDADGDKLSWFSRQNLLTFPWTDLPNSFDQNSRGDKCFTTAAEHAGRRFFINAKYGGCSNDTGWLVVLDVIPDGCEWVQNRAPFPAFLYANDTLVQNWQIGNIGQADDMVIFLSVEI